MTPAAQDMAIEAFLGLMVLLLVLSLGAIIRMPPVTGTTAPPPQDEAPGLTLGWPSGLAAGSESGTGVAQMAAPTPAPRFTPRPAPSPASLARPRSRRGRYVPRHVQGYVPPEREQGPPWGPADTPPGHPGV